MRADECLPHCFCCCCCRVTCACKIITGERELKREKHPNVMHETICTYTFVYPSVWYILVVIVAIDVVVLSFNGISVEYTMCPTKMKTAQVLEHNHYLQDLFVVRCQRFEVEWMFIRWERERKGLCLCSCDWVNLHVCDWGWNGTQNIQQSMKIKMCGFFFQQRIENDRQ